MSRTAEPWRGGRVTSRAWCVLAPNPGPMTLDGTNTWVLGEPGSGVAVVVDPGPDDQAHLDAVHERVHAVDAEVALVLLTHHHPDHAAGAAAFAAQAGAPLRAPTDGTALTVGGLRLEVLATPGHTADSVCFWLPDDAAILTGDTVLGRGTSVVAHPDGRLADYLASLARLHERSADAALLLPGHGPVLDDPAGALAAYREHRAQRLAQVEAAIAAGADGVDAVVAVVYADVDRALWPAAARSVAAQLEYLNARGA
jgi:glyoxylase-like metal-dependent hydrolase (beta-lactamase superfamily II)